MIPLGSIFQDAAAQKRHGGSEAVKRFESAYTPELTGGEVEFVDFNMIAGKLPAGNKAP